MGTCRAWLGLFDLHCLFGPTTTGCCPERRTASTRIGKIRLRLRLLSVHGRFLSNAQFLDDSIFDFKEGIAVSSVTLYRALRYNAVNVRILDDCSIEIWRRSHLNLVSILVEDYLRIRRLRKNLLFHSPASTSHLQLLTHDWVIVSLSGKPSLPH